MAEVTRCSSFVCRLYFSKFDDDKSSGKSQSDSHTFFHPPFFARMKTERKILTFILSFSFYLRGKADNVKVGHSCFVVKA